MIAFEERNIVLTGFMGTGKSTIGRELAIRLGFEFVDTDRLIEDRHGPIPGIFDRLGEAMFRSIERNIAAEVGGRTRHVVSTGGRMLVDDDNVRSLSSSGRIFCLHVAEEELIERLLASRSQRPLLETSDPAGTIRRLLAERRPAYRRFAQIDTSGLTPSESSERLSYVLDHDPRREDGLVGVAVLGTIGAQVAAADADDFGRPYLPSIGQTSGVGTVVIGDASHIADRAGHGDVVVPVTPDAIRHPTSGRRVIDLATLHGLPRERLAEAGIDPDADAIGLLEALTR